MATRQAASELISIDPANGAQIARVRITSAQELDAVVARACNAFRHSGWKSLLPPPRALVLHAIAAGLAAEKPALARLRCCSTPASRGKRARRPATPASAGKN